MAATEIASMNHRHEAIALWMLANPDKPLKECAIALGYTQSWLSIIINSQAFRDYYGKMREECDGPEIISLREKLTGVANMAIERLGERAQCEQDTKLLLDIADKALHRLGYAPQRGPEPAPSSTTVNQQNNFYTADPSLLAQARAAMLTKNDSKETILDALPAPEEVPAG